MSPSWSFLAVAWRVPARSRLSRSRTPGGYHPRVRDPLHAVWFCNAKLTAIERGDYFFDGMRVLGAFDELRAIGKRFFDFRLQVPGHRLWIYHMTRGQRSSTRLGSMVSSTRAASAAARTTTVVGSISGTSRVCVTAPRQIDRRKTRDLDRAGVRIRSHDHRMIVCAHHRHGDREQARDHVRIARDRGISSRAFRANVNADRVVCADRPRDTQRFFGERRHRDFDRRRLRRAFGELEQTRGCVEICACACERFRIGERGFDRANAIRRECRERGACGELLGRRLRHRIGERFAQPHEAAVELVAFVVTELRMRAHDRFDISYDGERITHASPARGELGVARCDSRFSPLAPEDTGDDGAFVSFLLATRVPLENAKTQVERDVATRMK